MWHIHYHHTCITTVSSYVVHLLSTYMRCIYYNYTRGTIISSYAVHLLYFYLWYNCTIFDTFTIVKYMVQQQNFMWYHHLWKIFYCHTFNIICGTFTIITYGLVVYTIKCIIFIIVRPVVHI